MGRGMTKRAAGYLMLGLLCSPLLGQQTVVIATRSEPALPIAATFPPSAKAATAIPPAAEFDAPAMIGLSGNSALYDAALPRGPETVCTQALTPVLAAAGSPYAFDHLQFTAAAFKGAFSHDNMVKMAHNFVPGQPFPNAPSYVGLTSRQKFDLFVHRSHSFDTISGAISDSITAQITGAYPTFGGGMAGYGKRLGAAAAGAESASFLGTFVFPTLFHQDPRYFRSDQTGISDRLAYAASRVVIGRSDDGRSVINTSLILSQFAQAAVSNAFIPYRNKNVSGTMENALAGIGSVAQARILNEFWPDIMRFVSRHEPKSVHQWQDRWDNSTLGQLTKNQ